jgi:hypothetical protein
MRLILLFLSVVSFIGFAQIPSEYGWTEAVANKYFFDSLEFHVSFDDFKRLHPEIKGNAALISEIEKENPRGIVVDFGSSDYYFEKGIKLNSKIVLNGSGIDSTKFIFDLVKVDHLIEVKGKRKITNIDLVDCSINQGFLECSDSSLIEGRVYWFYFSQNDDERMTSDWAKGKSGQIIAANYKSGMLYYDSHLRIQPENKRMPSIVELDMASKVGIENLTIINRSPASTPQERFSNIAFIYANNCWVENVKSTFCNYAHLQLDYSAFCSITAYQADSAFCYGGGGVGYGVVFQNAASSNSLMYSKFNHLRHSILFQIGANGNVAYQNISTNPYWTGNLHRRNRAGDIVFHGNYPYCNLVCKNKCNTIVFDRSHGLNGPNNWVHDNTVTGYGILMSRNSSLKAQSIRRNIILKGKLRVVKGTNVFSIE